MGNEMGNSNVSGLQEQDNNELQIPNKSSEASMQSNAADGVEVKFLHFPSEAKGFAEKLDESASINQSEMSDHQIQEQISTEREKENAKLQAPNKSLEALMPSNDEDGVDENQSALTPEEEDFPENPVKQTQIGAIDENVSVLPSEAEDFHEEPVKPSKVGEQIQNQTSTGEEETKTSKQTSTTSKLISMESLNQKNNEQESICSFVWSCVENSSHDKKLGSDSNQKGDAREILNECIDPHSDLDIMKNVKNMLMEETKNHRNEVLDKTCESGKCNENLVKLEEGYGLSRVSMEQPAGLENEDEQQTELGSVQNDSTKLPKINSFDSHQEANDCEIKGVCLEDHADVAKNGNETKSNDNQNPIFICEKGKEHIDESKTYENGKETDNGDKMRDSNDGCCSSEIERGVEVDKENEFKSRFGIESQESNLALDFQEHSKDFEREKEAINVATSLTEHKDTHITCIEIEEVVDDESLKESKLLESDEAEGIEITSHSVPFSGPIQKDVEAIELETNETEDSESFSMRLEESTEQMENEPEAEHELHTTSITEEETGSIEALQLILLQSDLTQKEKIMEGEMAEQIVPQSDRTQQEMAVEEEKEERILDQADPIQQDTPLVQAYLVSLDNSYEPQKELILLETGRSITTSDEENCTKVDHAKSFDANSSNPTFNTTILTPELEDPTSQASKVVEISAYRSGELSVLSIHKTNEQEQKCGLIPFMGVHDPNVDTAILENSDTFSFEFENLFAEAQAPALHPKKEELEQDSLHLQTETVRGVASATESGHSEPDRKDINDPAEVIKTDVTSIEVRIEESEKCPLLQQPNVNFHSELENPLAENRISVIKTSKEEPTETTMLLQKMSAASGVLLAEKSDLRKFKTPTQGISEEETGVVESLQKQENTVLKETEDEEWKSTKASSTSPGERKKHKPRYSLFGNCMCCTTVQ